MKQTTYSNIIKALESPRPFSIEVLEGTRSVVKVTRKSIHWDDRYKKQAPKIVKLLSIHFKNRLKDAIMNSAKKLSHLTMTSDLLEAIIKAEEKRFLTTCHPVTALLVSGNIEIFKEKLRKVS